ncbi:hypothetical protein [Lacrimispora xylanisolvens]|uniref:hypothetical protein n=1 Tax=Lacrimispora xylanisolvens TaxID=384636 RepID=UPI00240265F2
MDWDGILGDVISGSILLAAGGVGGWFIGLFKGKKKSSSAIKRKDEIYQPLIDDIEKYSKFNWSILEKVKAEFLREIVNDSYKYGLAGEVKVKCNYLNKIASEYNSIDPVRVADSIIEDIFTKGYAEIYGSIIDGISYHTDPEGNEWEEEIFVEPVQIINQINHSKEITSLLNNEGMYSDEVCIDKVNVLYEPIYLQLKRIYASALNVVINGKQYKHSKPVINLSMLPEEYMAYHYDFFELYNENQKIVFCNPKV